jgi:uncharacterized protein
MNFSIDTQHKNVQEHIMAKVQLAHIEHINLIPEAAQPEAYYELGMMYATGRNVAPDLIMAHKWFNIAVARGFNQAASKRAEVSLEMSSSEIATAQREARLWLTRH